MQIVCTVHTSPNEIKGVKNDTTTDDAHNFELAEIEISQKLKRNIR